MSSSLSSSVEESLSVIRGRGVVSPRVGIILGSGLSRLASAIVAATSIPYRDIPHMPQLSAQGHVGEWILGHLEQTPVVVMRGRAHLYEGHDPYVATYGVRLMAGLGVKTLIVSNAAGGLNPRYSVGDLIAIDHHLDFMNRTGLRSDDRPIGGMECAGIVARTGPIYDRTLLRRAKEVARTAGIALGCGTYLATLGPSYETRAEYRAFRCLGADMVGMSTVPETILAASLGMSILAFSVITNVAQPDVGGSTSHDDVLRAADRTQASLTAILKGVLATPSNA